MLIVELLAVGATALAAIGVVPQLSRLARTGDITGLSATAATVGSATELGWVVYTVDGRLWSAVPESVLMVFTNVALVVAVVRAGGPIGRSLGVATAWLAVLAAVAVTGGPAVLGPLLPLAYVGQVSPAVWSVYRVPSPTGVAVVTWVVIGVESALWGTYSLARGDAALSSLGAVGVVAAAAIVARATGTRHLGDEPVTSSPSLARS